MGYLYRGEFTFKDEDENNIDTIIDILRVADEEFLDDVSTCKILDQKHEVSIEQ